MQDHDYTSVYVCLAGSHVLQVQDMNVSSNWLRSPCVKHGVWCALLLQSYYMMCASNHELFYIDCV